MEWLPRCLAGWEELAMAHRTRLFLHLSCGISQCFKCDKGVHTLWMIRADRDSCHRILTFIFRPFEASLLPLRKIGKAGRLESNFGDLMAKILDFGNSFAKIWKKDELRSYWLETCGGRIYWPKF